MVPKPIWAIVQFNNLMFLMRFFTFSLIHCTAQAVLPGVDFLTLSSPSQLEMQINESLIIFV